MNNDIISTQKPDIDLKPVSERKIRVLALCDSPTSATGFAQVAKNILNGLVATGRFEIDVIGINYHGDYYDRDVFPYNIYPACPMGHTDMYGRPRIIQAITGEEARSGLKQGWDIIFTIQDSFVIEGLGLSFPFAEQLKVSQEMWKRSVPPEFWYNWIGYFPVDADLKENWVTRSIALSNYPVAYCEWGKQEMLKHDKEKFETSFNFALTEGTTKTKVNLLSPSLKDRIKVIHHGVDTKVFKPITDEEKKIFRKQFFKEAKLHDDTYLVVNVSRNQPRKDVTRTLAVFAKFKQAVPNSHLYLHSKVNDTGGSIHEMARNFKLSPGRDYSVPSDFSAGIGYPVDVVNKIYNAADLCMTTTLGEGWGFITTEAMATKTPIVAPYITSIIDIFGKHNPEALIEEQELRGIPVKAGSTSSEWICMGLEDNERIRPLTNVDDMVEKMIWAYNHPDKVKAITDRAYEWVQGLSWDNIIEEWKELFLEAYNDLEKQREFARRMDKTNRNEPCPCNSGKKFKLCHGSGDDKVKFQDWLEGGEKIAK